MLLATLNTSLLENLLMPPHPLTNFEMQKYYQKNPYLN